MRREGRRAVRPRGGGLSWCRRSRALCLGVLLLGPALGSAAEGSADARAELLAGVRAALTDAGKAGRAVSFSYPLAGPNGRARVVSAADTQLVVMAGEAKLWLKWEQLSATDVYHLADGALVEGPEKHTRLATYCLAARLNELAQRELKKLEDGGQALPPAAAKLAEQAKQELAKAREAQAEQAFGRLTGLLGKPERRAEAAAQLRKWQAAYADTRFAESKAEACKGLLESLTASSEGPAVLNIPFNDSGKVLTICNWPVDKRCNQLLASNSALDVASIVWFGRVPALERGAAPWPFDNYVEVRTIYDEEALHVVFANTDCSVTKFRDAGAGGQTRAARPDVRGSPRVALPLAAGRRTRGVPRQRHGLGEVAAAGPRGTAPAGEGPPGFARRQA